jgi:hypothetical protein
LAALGLAAWFPSAARAAETLRWKFTVGEKLSCSISQDMNMNIDAGQIGDLKRIVHQSMDMTWNVEGVNDQGDAVITQSIDRVRMKVDAPDGQGFEYDSDAEGPAAGMAALISPMFEAMTAGEYEVTMTPRGEVRSIHIPEEVANEIEHGPGGETAGGKDAVERFKTMVAQGALVLPAEPVTPGQKWSSKTAVNHPVAGNQTVETTFTFEGTRNIDGATYAVIRPSLAMNLVGNPTMKLTVKDQKTSGEVLFDVEAGRLHSMSIDQDMKLEIGVAGQSMPGTVHQKVEVQVTPKSEGTENEEQESGG